MRRKIDKEKVVSVIETRPGATHHEHATKAEKALTEKWAGQGVA